MTLHQRRTLPPRPLRLQRVLQAHGITQTELRQHLVQQRGRGRGQPLSPAAMSRLLTHGEWPALTDRAFIEATTLSLLELRGVPAAEQAGIWETDAPPWDLTEAPGDALPTPPTAGRRDQRRPPREFDNPMPEPEMLAERTKKHFHLFQDPFLDDVQGPQDVFLSDEQRYIREALWQAVNHGGFLAVIGESGAGKSVLRRDLVDRIQREGRQITLVHPASIDKRGLTAAALSEAVVCACSLESPCRTREARDRQVARVLTASARAGNKHALVIEEAHDLPITVLKMLKRYWELEDGFRRLLGIVLIGQPELAHALDERVNWDAREVIRRCEIATLAPLDGAVGDYLAAKFSRIGRDPAEIYTPDVPAAIQARLTQTDRQTRQVVSMVYPLSVNNALKLAMNFAADCAEPRVTADIIRSI